jgi:hypothetical protein
MLFQNPTVPLGPMDGDQCPRAFAVTELLCRFSEQFPQLSYELVINPMLVNAQALVIRGQRTVKLYGGLAFHSLIDTDALAFALLHETGHHLASGPRLPWNPFLACECQADVWAREKAISGTSGCTLDLPKALADLDAVFEFEANYSQRRTNIRSKLSNECWSTDWQKRRKALLSLTTFNSSHSCPLANALLLSAAERSEDGNC